MVYLALLEDKPFWSFRLSLLMKEVRQGIMPFKILSAVRKDKEVKITLKTPSGIKTLRVFKTMPPADWYPDTENKVRALRAYAVDLPVSPDLIEAFLSIEERPQPFKWLFVN